MGIRTFAVYAEEDKLSLHRFKADEAYQIGKSRGPLQAYLSKLNSCLQASVNSLRGSCSSLLCCTRCLNSSNVLLGSAYAT
jgi:hypothetical protein